VENRTSPTKNQGEPQTERFVEYIRKDGPRTTDKVSRTSTDLIVRKFAKVTTSGGTRTYKTPAVSFKVAQDLLNDYPGIARVIIPDFSPQETIVRFPGSGDRYKYSNVDGIPKITYTK